MKKLVAYFSASGTTKQVAKKLATVLDADIYEIIPKQEYTREDLNWMDKKSRSTLEMKDSSSRPQIKNGIQNMEQFEIVFLGFPIWWYTAPRIINTFLESYDFSNKTIVLFATSGGSELGNCAKELQGSCAKTTKIISGGTLNENPTKEELLSWARSFNL